MEVIKFYGRFFGNISAAYGVSGYFQAHTKSRYPPWVSALYVQRIYINTPTQSQYLMGLRFATPMPACGVCMGSLESLPFR